MNFMKFTKLSLAVLAIVSMAACDSNHQAGNQPQYQQPAQQAPVVVQQSAPDNSLMTGVMAGGLGYMLGKSAGSNQQAQQPQYQPAQQVNKTVVNKTVNNYIVAKPPTTQVTVNRAALSVVSQKPIQPMPSYKPTSNYKQSPPTVSYKSSSNSSKK